LWRRREARQSLVLLDDECGLCLLAFSLHEAKHNIIAVELLTHTMPALVQGEERTEDKRREGDRKKKKEKNLAMIDTTMTIPR